MTLPINIVIVRHGQSEGNAAKRLSEAGDHTALERLRGQHTSSYCLTEKGIKQAQAAGAWLRAEFCKDNPGFDKYHVSTFLRAMETAGHLNLPDARWYLNFYLCERDWGKLDLYTEDERWEKFGDILRMKTVEPFFWKPPNGESFAQLCLRIDRGELATLHRECYDKSVILTCHGEVMWAYRVLLERMPQQRFRELNLSQNPDDRIHNCQIFHYTRRDPKTGRLAPYANWYRSVRPTECPLWDTGWQTIKRLSYSNDDLLALVDRMRKTDS